MWYSGRSADLTVHSPVIPSTGCIGMVLCLLECALPPLNADCPVVLLGPSVGDSFALCIISPPAASDDGSPLQVLRYLKMVSTGSAAQGLLLAAEELQVCCTVSSALALGISSGHRSGSQSNSVSSIQHWVRCAIAA
jgi:hypothetical protein